MQRLLKSNPIIQAEFRHQRFVIQRARVGRFWIFLAALLVIPSLFASLYYAGVALWQIINPPQDPLPQSITDIPGTLLVVMAISMYIVVTLITLGLSANSIQREKAGSTWENLRLTDLSTWQIIIGKWWASLRALFGDHVMVNVLRIGFIAFVLVTYVPLFGAVNRVEGVNYALYFLPLVPISLLYGLLDAALTAALGILGSVPDEAAGTVIASTAMSARFVASVGGGAWLILTLYMIALNNIAGVVLLTLLGLSVYAASVVLTLWVAQRLMR